MSRPFLCVNIGLAVADGSAVFFPKKFDNNFFIKTCIFLLSNEKVKFELIHDKYCDGSELKSLYDTALLK